MNVSRFSAVCFVAPAILGLLAFVVLPFLLAILLAFTNLRMGSPLPLEWVGMEQFRRVFADATIIRAFVNNAGFALIVVPLQTLLALALALLLNCRLRGMVVFRTLFFMPAVFPLALVGVVWILLFAPGANGMMNAALEVLTLGAWQPKDFLHDPVLAMPAIILTSIWQGVGFQMVIVLAGLQAIPDELYQAAAMDGASKWRQLVHITLPQLKNTLIFVVLVTTILAFRLFDQVQIMTQGGPQNATTTAMYEAIKAAFERQQVAKGSAVTVLLFLIVMLIAWLQRRMLRNEREIA